MKTIHLNNLKYRIMLRVWYAFFIARLDSSSLGNGLLLGGAVAAFGRLTHVEAIFNNLLQVSLGNLPSYIWQTLTSALVGGKVLTVLVTVAMVLLAFISAKRLWGVLHNRRFAT